VRYTFLEMEAAKNDVAREYNAILDFALDKCPHNEAVQVLRLWREGSFDVIRREWPEFIFPDTGVLPYV